MMDTRGEIEAISRAGQQTPLPEFQTEERLDDPQAVTGENASARVGNRSAQIYGTDGPLPSESSPGIAGSTVAREPEAAAVSHRDAAASPPLGAVEAGAARVMTVAELGPTDQIEIQGRGDIDGDQEVVVVTVAPEYRDQLVKIADQFHRSEGGITVRLEPSAGFPIDWEGRWDTSAECKRAGSGEILDSMAALTTQIEGQARRWFIHHRADGTISWPALATSMARLCTRAVDLSREERDTVFNHLAEHYRELGIEPPSPGEKSPGEAYDLALLGRIAHIDESDNVWLFAKAETVDGRAWPLFRATDSNHLAAFAIPTIGRLQNHQLWGSRSVPDPSGNEALLERLETTQRDLLHLHEQRAGSQFSKRNRERIQAGVETLEGIATLLKQARGEAAGLANDLKGMIATDETDPDDDAGRANDGGSTESREAPATDGGSPEVATDGVEALKTHQRQFSRQITLKAADALEDGVDRARQQRRKPSRARDIFGAKARA